MREKLKTSLLRRRQEEISERNPLKYLKSADVETLLDAAIEAIFLFTRGGGDETPIYLANMISAIGGSINSRVRTTRDSAKAAKAGAFVLYSFEEAGILQVKLGHGPKKHAAYHVNILNDSAIADLWRTISVEKCEKLPALEKPSHWETGRKESGLTLIKTQCEGVLDGIHPKTHPMIFECANKSQDVGWIINDFIFEVESWAFAEKTEAFSGIWNLVSAEARKSKIRETRTILGIASKVIGRTFWHHYTYDFRGRKYVSTAYLHEQGSDVARGLLLRADCKRLTEQGYYWLLISIASNWAGSCGRADGYKTDKIPLQDRIEWVLKNEAKLISYAEAPKVNTGWYDADAPWQFLAACRELKLLRDWQAKEWHDSQLEGRTYDPYGYESHAEVYLDGLLKSCQ